MDSTAGFGFDNFVGIKRLPTLFMVKICIVDILDNCRGLIAFGSWSWISLFLNIQIKSQVSTANSKRVLGIWALNVEEKFWF